MRRNHVLSAFAAGALLLAFLATDRPHGVPLGDDLLASITGLDTHTIGFSTDCAFSNTRPANGNDPGVVTPNKCPNPGGANPPQCVTCQDGGYTGGGDAGTGEGGWHPGGQYSCGNSWRRLGTCQANGTCGTPRTVQFCAGNPVAYDTQYPPG